MDSTDVRIARAKKKAKKRLLWMLVGAAPICLAAFLLYQYSDVKLLLPEPANVSYDFRCDGRDIQYAEDGKWEDFIMRGVELGAVQTEYNEYLRQLTSICDMNANAVRVHVLMPPDFYRAFHDLNRSGRTLWLVQGVELSDDTFSAMTDMRSGNMVRLMRTHGRHCVDALHGNMGDYKCDVSQFTMAYIVGDKWDPNLVLYTDHEAADIAGDFKGKYASVWNTAKATPTLLAQVIDDIFRYETLKYAQQHLIGLGNTYKTDALFHDSTWALGFNENIASVNTCHISASTKVKTGVFAACRIDAGVMQCMSFDPEYINYKDPDGNVNPVRYYVDALYNAHRIPVLLGGATVSAACGVSGSDEILGYDRGGIGEKKQAEGLCFIYSQAVDAGLCGGFAGWYTDEPTATAWNTEKFAEHNGRWLDAQDSEQSLGLVALEPDSPYKVDGDASEWAEVKSITAGAGMSLKAAGDEKYLYLHINIEGYNADRDVIYVPFDIAPFSGSTACANQKLTFDRNIDFLLAVNGSKRAKLTVQEYYNVQKARNYQELYSEFWFTSMPGASENNFDDITQYARPALYPVGKDKISALHVPAGLLRYGNADPQSKDYDSLANYCLDGDDIEVRIPWALLNFSDPSKGEIIGDPGASMNARMAVDALYIGLSVYHEGNLSSCGSGALSMPCFTGTAYRERVREAYYSLKKLYGDQKI